MCNRPSQGPILNWQASDGCRRSNWVEQLVGQCSHGMETGFFPVLSGVLHFNALAHNQLLEVLSKTQISWVDLPHLATKTCQFLRDSLRLCISNMQIFTYVCMLSFVNWKFFYPNFLVVGHVKCHVILGCVIIRLYHCINIFIICKMVFEGLHF